MHTSIFKVLLLYVSSIFLLLKISTFWFSLFLFQRYPVVMSTYLGIMGRVLLQNARFFSLLLSQMACELGQEVRFIVLLYPFGFFVSWYFSSVTLRSLAFFWHEETFPSVTCACSCSVNLEKGLLPLFFSFPWTPCNNFYMLS